MSAKQRPSVLVTDARERSNQRRPARRQDTSSGAAGRAPMRFMTVDNVLQYNSQIPSGQPRGPPVPAQRSHSAAGGLLPSRRISAGGLPTAQSRTGQAMPSRTTKISGKLVLLPETDHKGDETEEEADSQSDLVTRLQDEENRPLRDEELDVLRKRGGIRGKSYAERLPKVQRKDKISRLTAYCTAQAFKVRATSEFMRTKHEAKTKLYDDCLYVIYALPLLNGAEGYRVRGRPMLKTPGTGKTMLDLEIERSEQRDHHQGYFEEDAYTTPESPETANRIPPPFGHPSPDDEARRDNDDGIPSQINRLAPDTKNFAEVFVFSYGVVVFWNFTEHQEKDILADITFAGAEDGTSLLTGPLEQDDFETEEFHFEYSAEVKRPRVFNDMITLLPRSDHMIKLTISHAIAQSTKLCFFEERMSETMLEAQHVPKILALTGELNMTRTEIVKMLGRLFKSRVDINLSSKILDVPNFFWDSEPTLHPLYQAVREYLEIDPRIKVLNERCRVFLDLAEILSDSVADAKMSTITWIIIVLIVFSILVTVTEVGLRFGMLSKSSAKAKAGATSVSWSGGVMPAAAPEMVLVPPPPPDRRTPAGRHAAATGDVGGIEMLALALGLQPNATTEDIRLGIVDLKQDASLAGCKPGR